MQESNFSFLIDPQPFRFISGIKFTQREIDIVACILNGRDHKTIAALLSIAPRTVETHLRNIMLKLECNSKQGIINFIENADAATALRNYYEDLLMQANFEKQLQSLGGIIRKNELICRLLYDKNDNMHGGFMNKLARDLGKAGIKSIITDSNSFSTNSSSDKEVFLHLISEESRDPILRLYQKEIDSKNINLVIFIFCGEKSLLKDLQETNNIKYVSFYGNYQLPFLEVLQKICRDSSLEEIMASYKQKLDALRAKGTQQDLKEKINTPKDEGVASQEKTVENKIKVRFLWVWLLPLILGSLATYILFSPKLTFKEGQRGTQLTHPIGTPSYPPLNHSVRSNLPIPTENILLKRSEIIHQIDNNLQGNDKIQTVALIGAGGAGKTILARQYAHQHKANIMWEINAETHESLKWSFENLAQALAQVEEDKILLKEIGKIKGAKEQERKIIQFVKEHLKRNSKWLLIYDNVERFSDIQEYYPSDSNDWGNGKVLLTSRDSNIKNNKFINSVIQIGELRLEDKFILFSQIMKSKNGYEFSKAEEEQVKKFLTQIPSFPLDITIAAYYIKTTNTSYKSYLSHLTKYNQDFTTTQEDILKEATEYYKTRFSIISLSLEKVIEAHGDFKGLLLFISLLDSSNIPRGLLDAYKNDIVVDNFIYNLKKYSLIIDSVPSSPSTPTLSIHQSTQEIILAYLTKLLNLEKAHNPLLQSIITILEDYVSEAIEREDIDRIRILLRHCESFLNHCQMFQPLTRNGFIRGQLGCLYYYLGAYAKAQAILEKALSELQEDKVKNYDKITHFSSYLGNIYKNLGNHLKAKELLEHNFEVCKKYLPKKHDQIVESLTQLGNLYKNLGNYQKAKELLEQALIISKEHLSDRPTHVAWIATHLGNVYKDLGNYEKARVLLEQGLNIYKQHYSKSHIRIAWNLTYLGSIYGYLGEYEKARALLEESYELYKKYFPENQVDIARTLTYLGSTYTALRQYKQAKEVLDKSLKIYKVEFKDTHPKLAWVLSNLGIVHSYLGNYKEAHIFFEKSTKIYQEHYSKDHIETARLLKDLGYLYYLEGHRESAEQLTKAALETFEKNKHPESYTCLENLANIYLKNSIITPRKKGLQDPQESKKIAKKYLMQAYEKAKLSFPKNSPHIARIQLSLQMLEESNNTASKGGQT